MRKAIPLLAAVALPGLTLAGCGGSNAAHTPSPSPTSPSPSRAFATMYGQDAALIAPRIKGCDNVAAASIGNGAATGMVGKATCTMLGHEVIIYTWKDAASEDQANSSITGITTYASGIGWSQILGDDAAADAQTTISNAVADALGGTVNR
jgi:hypothetical protein